VLSSLPNLLTLSRIVAIPVLIFLMWGGSWQGYLGALAVYIVAAATDYLDGYLARAQGTVSRLGIFLDPVADKLMVATVIIMLVANTDIAGIHVLAATIILLREITVSGLREFLATARVSLPVSQLAKWKTAVQMVALGALIAWRPVAQFWPALPVHEAGLAALWVAALLTLVTGWDYLRTGLRHMVEAR
jgi:CDP-diacylglycerol--glycerol-3-phosphate 3-phosphatidyltransferase